ncbi:hypothetical protein OGAPHI_004282 [Ogataea philodendri]|uniref:Uncharacterized protein n=1 Tax=Ogataea philodendri TaxID=1378263 RepID=A0A9P8T4M1_9ASCO|nr:uncharacterized protein OGAPHI_004282 [Ogataea philodendri]KAH3666093.1 hypothetical protein OGAPHI_004282 [Ogataea philodendri]
MLWNEIRAGWNIRGNDSNTISAKRAIPSLVYHVSWYIRIMFPVSELPKVKYPDRPTVTNSAVVTDREIAMIFRILERVGLSSSEMMENSLGQVKASTMMAKVLKTCLNPSGFHHEIVPCLSIGTFSKPVARA